MNPSSLETSRPASSERLRAPLSAADRVSALSALPNLGDNLGGNLGGSLEVARRPPAWQAPDWLPAPRPARFGRLFAGRRPALTGQDSVLRRMNDRHLERVFNPDGPGVAAGYTLEATFRGGHCTALTSLWLHHKALGNEPAFHARLARFADGSATDSDHDKLANALRWLKYDALTRGMLQGNALSPLDVAVGVRRTGSRVAHQDAAQLAAWLHASLPAGHLAFITANVHACGLYHGQDGQWHLYDPNQFGEARASTAASLAPLLARAFFLTSSSVTVSNFYTLDDALAAAGEVHALPYSAQTQIWQPDVPYTQESWHLALAFQNADAVAQTLAKIPRDALEDALVECIDQQAEEATLAVLERMAGQGMKPLHGHIARALRMWPAGFALLPLPQHLDAALEGSEGNLLACAAAEENFAAVQALLQAGANPNAVVGRHTALGEAARNGDLPTLRLLLNAGARPDAHARGAVSPLMLAAKEAHVPALEALLRAGARPDACVGGVALAGLARTSHLAAALGVEVAPLPVYIRSRFKLAKLERLPLEAAYWGGMDELANPSLARRLLGCAR